ncbi:MAG: hypothetical protein DA330_05100 [Nitrososphaera sp.]|nr:hypothetical protein [Nitrososphaera sp.]
MNKPVIVALAALAVFFSATAASVQPAQAQYGTSGSVVGAPTQEQLDECEQLGIDKAQCNEHNLLAKRRLTAAQANPATGSGTPMLSTAEGQTWVFIGVLAAIFGGVAAAFFFRGRGATPPA